MTRLEADSPSSYRCLYFTLAAVPHAISNPVLPPWILSDVHPRSYASSPRILGSSNSLPTPMMPGIQKLPLVFPDVDDITTPTTPETNHSGALNPFQDVQDDVSVFVPSLLHTEAVMLTLLLLGSYTSPPPAALRPREDSITDHAAAQARRPRVRGPMLPIVASASA
ncbi:hypothetical protein CVT26_014301 [Gymnopilus dilepis]|uniref:Uncharacterized protein n=1 Tax=Gymnopilus dilepis TaxID=231916 RepID=A0A409Y8I8_9AGAR|nr:hypothetical protein CVT26_014301 [Gymnopilus dilepis]